MILDCGHEPSPHPDCTTGYSIDKDDRKHCYECCAELHRQQMINDGRTMLYLIDDNRRVADWADWLSFDTYYTQKGKHNFAKVRRDVWFIGPDKHVWHGVQYGYNTMIVHCKRTKEKVEK